MKQNKLCIVLGVFVLLVAAFTACKGPVGPMGKQGIQGEKGDKGDEGAGSVSVVWKGESATAPANPQLNWVYYNSVDKKSYIFNGTSWQLLTEDDEIRPQGPKGEDGEGSSSFIPVTGLSLNASVLTLRVGEPTTLIPTVLPANASNKNVNWISINPAVAEVDADGTVTAVASGTTVIIAITVNGSRMAVCTVTSYTLPLTDVNHVIPYLALQTGGLTTDNPVNLPMRINLGSLTAANSEWQNLLAAINTAGKYINLDLSACTMTTVANTYFDPDGTYITGKDRIVSLILPNMATRIVGKLYVDIYVGYKSSFYGFSKLEKVEGLYIIGIDDYAFRDCTSLIEVNFPVATAIGEEQTRGNSFSGCTSLTKVNFPAVTIIKAHTFEGCTSLTEVNIPKITTIEWDVFSNTGTGSLTITMGLVAPYNIYGNLFQEIAAKTVTIKVPALATGYGTFTGSPPTITVSGTDTTKNWANGFRGGGWGGSGGTINSNITLYIVQEN